MRRYSSDGVGNGNPFSLTWSGAKPDHRGMTYRTIRDVAAACGTQQQCADAVGYKRAAVEAWIKRNNIPSHCLARVIDGAKQAKVKLTLEELVEIMRPDRNGRAA